VAQDHPVLWGFRATVRLTAITRSVDSSTIVEVVPRSMNLRNRLVPPRPRKHRTRATRPASRARMPATPPGRGQGQRTWGGRNAPGPCGRGAAFGVRPRVPGHFAAVSPAALTIARMLARRASGRAARRRGRSARSGGRLSAPAAGAAGPESGESAPDFAAPLSGFARFSEVSVDCSSPVRVTRCGSRLSPGAAPSWRYRRTPDVRGFTCPRADRYSPLPPPAGPDFASLLRPQAGYTPAGGNVSGCVGMNRDKRRRH